MKKIQILIAMVIVFAPLSLYADRGGIPFNAGVEIFEPNQRAMIAWDGKEEILLLTTNLRTSAPTKILEVIPLPSEPKVTKGDVEVFRKATKLINEKLALGSHAKSLGNSRLAESPSGEITFHKKIGAHDISVTHVLDASGFINWVKKYLQSADVKNPEIPEILKQTVEQYLREGFAWFVFDVVELDSNPKTAEAIQYKFKSDSLFYPLKISRTGKGHTEINLLILTPRLLSNFPGLPSKKVKLLHRPISISSRELRSLNEEMDELLGHSETLELRIWGISGDLSSFNEDLIAD